MRNPRPAVALWTALVVTAASLLLASPAQAAPRTFIEATHGRCLWDVASSDRIGVRAKPCATKPVSAGRWSVTGKGTFNGHPVWQLKNSKTGKCLTRRTPFGAGSAPFMDPCSNSWGSDQRWEVFYTGSGKKRMLTLKSLGAWQNDRKHVCVRYMTTANRGLNIVMDHCNVKSKLQLWRA